MTKKLTILIPVLALILLVSACAKTPVVNQNSNVNTNQNQNVDSTPTPTPSPVAEIDTSSWQTYRNVEYGFELKYPKDWEMDYIYSTIINFAPNGKYEQLKHLGDVKLVIRENGHKLTIDKYYDGINHPDLSKDASGGYEIITFNNKQVYYFRGVMGLMASDVAVLMYNDKVIEISAIDNYEIFKEIIKTIIIH